MSIEQISDSGQHCGCTRSITVTEKWMLVLMDPNGEASDSVALEGYTERR